MKIERTTSFCGCVVERETTLLGIAAVLPCERHRKDPRVFVALVELKGALDLDRVVLLLAESAKHQVLSAGLQQQALDEIAKLNTALSLVFQRK